MTQIDWSEAPEWATRLMRNIGGVKYKCWADDGDRALTVNNPPSQEFKLLPNRWILIELRPIRTAGRIEGDDRLAAIEEMKRVWMEDGFKGGGFAALYDAGYRKPNA